MQTLYNVVMSLRASFLPFLKSHIYTGYKFLWALFHPFVCIVKPLPDYSKFGYP